MILKATIPLEHVRHDLEFFSLQIYSFHGEHDVYLIGIIGPLNFGIVPAPSP